MKSPSPSSTAATAQSPLSTTRSTRKTLRIAGGLQHAALATALTACMTVAQAGPSNLWTDNHVSESQVIPLTTPNQGIARARQLLDDGDTTRAATALQKVLARWPSSEEARQLLNSAQRKLGDATSAAIASSASRADSASIASEAGGD